MGLADLAEKGVITEEAFRKRSASIRTSMAEWDELDDKIIRTNMREQELRNKAQQPRAIPGLYVDKPAGTSPVNRIDFPWADTLREEEPWLYKDRLPSTEEVWRRVEYVNEFEDIYHTGGPEMFAWAMEQDIDDLRILQSNNLSVDQEVISSLVETRRQLALQRGNEFRAKQELDKRVEERSKDLERGRNLLRIFRVATGGVDTLVDAEGRIINRMDEGDFESIAREQLIEPAMEDTEPPSFGDTVSSAFQWTMGKIGEGIGWTVNQGETFAVGQLNKNLPGSPFMTPAERATAEQEAAIEDVRSINRSEGQIASQARQLQFNTAQEMFNTEEMNEAMPGVADEWIEMVGGDEVMAANLFAGMLADSLEPEDQVQILEDLDEAHIRVLQEQEWELNSAVLNTMAAYDKLVPSSIATGAMLLLTDRDIQSRAFRGEFEGFYEEIKNQDYNPASVIGLENTAAGLALNIAGSWMFDPTNWVFGPSAARAMGRIRNVDDAAVQAAKGYPKHLQNDIVKAVSEGDSAALAYLAGPILEADPDKFLQLHRWIRKADEATEGALAPGLLPTQTDDLQRILDISADELTSNVSGGVRGTLEGELDGLAQMSSRELALDAPSGGGVRQIAKDSRGVEYTAHLVGDLPEGGKALVWKSVDGEIGGYFRWTPGKGAGMLKTADIKDFFAQNIDAIREAREFGNSVAADALISASKDPSITAAAAHVIKKQTQRLIDEAGGRSQAIRDALPTETVTKLFEEALLEGADFGQIRTGMVAAARGHALMDDLLDSVNTKQLHNAMERNMHPYNITSVMPNVGPQAYRQALHNLHFMWGRNREMASKWASTLVERLGKGVDDLDARLGDSRWHEAEVIGRQIDNLDNNLKQITNRDMSTMSRGLDEIKGMQALKANLETKFLELKKGLDKDYPNAGQSPLATTMQEMWDDFNREVISKNPQWKDFVDPETGMVPWDKLKIGGVTPTDKLTPSLAPFADLVDARKFDSAVQELVGSSTTYNVPISPMDMVVAASTGGARYVQAVNRRAWVAGTRNAVASAHRAWTLDKVASIGTAGVVSFDELQRLMHRYGADFAMQYATDRAMFTAARAQALVRKGKLNKYQGVEYLGEKWQKRFQALDDIPDQIQQAENLTWDRRGMSVMEIDPQDPGYTQAAREYYRHFTSSPAFNAAMQGEDAFRRWYYSPDGIDARKISIDDGEGGIRLQSWEEAYLGQQTVMEILTRGVPKGKLKEVRNAIIEAAKDAQSGGQGYMPKDVFNYTPSVTGAKKPGFANVNLVGKGLEFMTDKFFMDPTNYRRGLLYNLSTKAERSRLVELFQSQGRRVIPDAKLVDELGLPAGTSLAQLPPEFVDAVARRGGIVTESHVRQLAHARAMDELQDTFYAWNQGTRAGRGARGAFPFGGPWADMWAFWGREMLSTPVVRGNASTSVFWSSLQKGADAIPFNPKTASYMSRIANSNFDLSRGLVGEESVDVDLSPLFFFPTQGENAFQTLLPGLGVLPSGMLDFAVERMLESNDPLEEPEAYQRNLDMIAAFIPSVQYTTGDIRSDLLGGGNLAKLFQTGAGLWAAAGGEWNSSSWMGDYSAEIDYNREVSAILAEDVLDLLGFTDVEDLDVAIMAVVNEAKTKAGLEQAGEKGTRFFVPARVDFDDAAEELQDVWINWGKSLDVDFGLDTADLDNGEVLRQKTDDLRNYFFDLSPMERDQAVLDNPQLAVNLVSNWTWTAKAKSELGREATLNYRSGGSQEALARHQTYIERGYLQPITPTEKVYKILGTVASARKNVGKAIYSESASVINDVKWDNVVNAETRGKLSYFLSEFGDIYGLGEGEERKLWERWGSYEDNFEFQLADDLGMEVDSPVFKEVQEQTNITDVQRAVSTTWPGVAGATDTFNNWPVGLFPPSDQTLSLMESLGVDYDEEMTGEQLFQGIVNNYLISPSFEAEVLAPFAKQRDDASAAPSSAESGLNAMAYTDTYDEDFRENIKAFRILVENTQERISDRGYALRSDLDTVRDRYGAIMHVAGEDAAMKQWWKDSYERDFGPLDWKAPSPPSLFDLEGNLNGRAYQPVIRKITDGDSLVVESSQNTLMPNSIMGRPVDPGIPAGYHKVRLLGVRARDFGIDDDGALEDRATLQQVLLDAVENGDSIYLVRDPDQFGSNTDKYGRELAWLFIGDEPFYSDEAFLPTDD